jgi:hypothetical protein
MAAPPQQGTSQQSSSVMTMEGVFIAHYMGALQALQNTWLYSESDDGIDANKFSIQLEYLIRLIPSQEIQEKIRKEQDAAIAEFTENNLDHPLERAGLVCVTHLIEFICNSFDLLHTDIFGPGVNGQYQQLLEVPDMPIDITVAAKEPAPSQPPEPSTAEVVNG